MDRAGGNDQIIALVVAELVDDPHLAARTDGELHALIFAPISFEYNQVDCRRTRHQGPRQR